MKSSDNSRPVCAFVPAAGSGSRFRATTPLQAQGAHSNQETGTPSGKLWETLGGDFVWVRSLRTLVEHRAVQQVVMAVPESDQNSFDEVIGRSKWPVRTVPGGAERSDSVAAMIHEAVRSMAEKGFDIADFDIAVHDAARPLLTHEDLDQVLGRAAETGAAFLAAPVTASLHRIVGNGSMAGGESVAVDRRGLFAAATPQVFRADWFFEANRRHRGRPATDDATMIQRSGRAVTIVPGRADNLKITHREDLSMARAILQARSDEPSQGGSSS